MNNALWASNLSQIWAEYLDLLWYPVEIDGKIVFVCRKKQEFFECAYRKLSFVCRKKIFSQEY